MPDMPPKAGSHTQMVHTILKEMTPRRPPLLIGPLETRLPLGNQLQVVKGGVSRTKEETLPAPLLLLLQLPVVHQGFPIVSHLRCLAMPPQKETPLTGLSFDCSPQSFHER